MHIAIIDNGSDSLAQLVYLCEQSGHTFDVVSSEGISSAILDSRDFKTYDLLILSGGLWHDDPSEHEAHYGKHLRLIARSGTPILGICLGMQLIASVFGGQLTLLKMPAHGKQDIRVTELGQRLLGWDSTVTVFENHTIGVTEIPTQFDLLASSDSCAEMMRHKTLPIAGVQFHPELIDHQESLNMWNGIIDKLCINNLS